MSVYTRTDSRGRKIYWFRFTILGREFERSTRQEDRQVAINMEAEFRTNYVKNGMKEPAPPEPARVAPTLTQFIPRFMEYCDRRQIKPSTRALYVRLLEKLSTSKTLQALPLSEIRAAAFEAYVSERMGSANQRGVYTAIRRERTLLLQLLKYACAVEEIAGMPVLFTAGKGAQKRREFIPDEATYTKFLQAAQPVLRDAAILSSSTGMRPGEIVDLRRREVSHVEDGFVVTLEDSKSEMGKRPIHVSRKNANAACCVLAVRSENIPEDGLLFSELTGTREKRVDTLSKMHTALRKSLALDERFVFYSFRHLYITAAGKGLQPQELRELARHQDIQTTMIYFNPSEDRRREIAANVKLLNPGSSQA